MSLLGAVGERLGLGPWDRALLHLIWATGVRVSGAAGVSLDNLHLDDRSATILGKGQKQQLVFFDDPCREDLVRWCEILSDLSALVGQVLERLRRTAEAQSEAFTEGLGAFPGAFRPRTRGIVFAVSCHAPLPEG